MECDIVGPHVDSFNYFIDEGLDAAVKDIPAEELITSDGQKIRISFTSVSIGYPTLSTLSSKTEYSLTSTKIYPRECRQRGLTYKAPMRCSYQVLVNNVPHEHFERHVCDVPVMVMSSHCNLNGMTSTQLVEKGEEDKELGGYFVVNGKEKVVRLLTVSRRNFPQVFARSNWRNRGKFFTEFGLMMRCVRENHHAVMNFVHYLTNRRMMYCITMKKEQYFIPIYLLLRAVRDCPESFLFDELLRGRREDDCWNGCVVNIVSDLENEGIRSRVDALQRLGSVFRHTFRTPPSYTDVQLGMLLLDQYVLIHLPSHSDKFNALVYMMQKLAALVTGECKEEHPDNTVYQEVVLPGHTILMLLREKLQAHLEQVKETLMETLTKKQLELNSRVFDSVFNKCSGKSINRSLEFFLATGNLISSTGLALSQKNGLAIIAERLNHLRYISHFRGIHRGANFQQIRTTNVRKLNPETWGFICPVHTPDGAPCGLLNHLTAGCRVTCRQANNDHVKTLLAEAGMIGIDEASFFSNTSREFLYPVIMNGQVLGYLTEEAAHIAETVIRTAKVNQNRQVPPTVEVVLVPRTNYRSLYPSFWIFTAAARMMRPVRNLTLRSSNQEEAPIEYIGMMEQLFLNICVKPSEFIPNVTTHQEVEQTSILSYVANLIPYPDHNQSPRNVYQCQMGKQTMGTPAHSISERADNKVYRIQTPQSPLVRPDSYDIYDVDRYPLGTNAIVAVISYTGYDMEDAMIINKASYERGFAYGSVYKNDRIDLTLDVRSVDQQLVFCRDPNDATLARFVDNDGLPYIGRKCDGDEPYYCMLEVATNRYIIKRYNGSEPTFIDNVKICGFNETTGQINHVVICEREQRAPTIGDKFASRHGQKGICSFLWPQENMPFTESGLVPDIIFNPHGFPSRMTVGMMIESMAGKSACAHGVRHSATPFRFSEDDPAVEYFGTCLQKAGFNYYGNESMYSGVDGREFKVQIFFGVIYYQRLRHMVADKYQVRATGPIDPVTQQPVKGRKRAGGIRFGEMERDSLISHGVSFLLRDRLFVCSDYDTAHVCGKCGGYLSVTFQRPDVAKDEENNDAKLIDTSRTNYCRLCKSSENIKFVTMPHVVKYLLAEMSSVNVKVKLSVES